MAATYAMQCPSCGRWQACQVNDLRTYTFQCRRESCKKSRKAKLSTVYGISLNHDGPYAAKDVARIVAAHNTPKGVA